MPCLIYKFVRLTTFRKGTLKMAAHTPAISLSLAPRATHTHISYVKFMFIFWLMFFLVATAEKATKKRESKPLLSLTPAGAACGHSGCCRDPSSASRLPPPACCLLPEVTVKAFSINSLSEFQYILTIWPLAKLHSHTLTRQIDDSLPVAKPQWGSVARRARVAGGMHMRTDHG